MATRDDVLIELKLMPVWRQRRLPKIVTPASEVVGIDANNATDTSVAAPALARRFDAQEGAQPAVVPTPQHAKPASQHAKPASLQHTPDDIVARQQRIAALTWPMFNADVAACTACGLSRTRKQTVPGVGDIDADWLFVGEAPGSEEDAKGEPFVGQAGRLLDNMLAAVGLARGRGVYIANVQKCRPPNNRTPEPGEVEACRPYLDRQIALIQPKLIVALGKSAASTLLGTDASIASLRGRIHRYRDVPLLVTYHPAYLLRTLADKAKAWEDLLLARRTMARLASGEVVDPARVS